MIFLTEMRDLGWLDANLFVHPFFNNSESAHCRKILTALKNGEVRGRLDHIIIHEILYTLKKLMGAGHVNTIADYMMVFIQCENIDVADRHVVIRALDLWGSGRHKMFGDAMLEARHVTTNTPVCSADQDLSHLPNTYRSWDAH